MYRVWHLWQLFAFFVRCVLGCRAYPAYYSAALSLSFRVREEGNHHNNQTTRKSFNLISFVSMEYTCCFAMFWIIPFMFLIHREKKQSRNGSLKVLDHAMSGPNGVDNCNKFVDILGLRTIFPLFMKTPKKNRKRMLTVEEHEGISHKFCFDLFNVITFKTC